MYIRKKMSICNWHTNVSPKPEVLPTTIALSISLSTNKQLYREGSAQTTTRSFVVKKLTITLAMTNQVIVVHLNKQEHMSLLNHRQRGLENANSSAIALFLHDQWFISLYAICMRMDQYCQFRVEAFCFYLYYGGSRQTKAQEHGTCIKVKEMTRWMKAEETNCYILNE